jgi:hypothetical protein
MFWTIVGALVFFFIGLPIIFSLITSKEFWKLVGFLLVILVVIGGCVALKNSDKPNKSPEPTSTRTR